MGSGGMLPRNNSENLHAVRAILVLFEQFSGIVCSYQWPLTSSVSSNMIHLLVRFRLGYALEMAWAAKRPSNEPLTGLFTGPLTARFYLCL